MSRRATPKIALTTTTRPSSGLVVIVRAIFGVALGGGLDPLALFQLVCYIL